MPNFSDNLSFELHCLCDDGTNNNEKGYQAVFDLIKKGANPNHEHRKETPLQRAVQARNVMCVDALLINGAEPNKTQQMQMDALRSSAISDACREYFYDGEDLDFNVEERLNIIKKLIQYKADIYTEDSTNSWFPVNWPTMSSVKIIDYFIDNGFDLNRKNKHGMTALEIAKDSEPEVYQYMLRKISIIKSVQELNESGRTLGRQRSRNAI